MNQLTELHSACRTYAQKLTQNNVLADDLVQEALKRFFDNDAALVSNREGYIKRTIHNLFVNGLRKEKRHKVFVSRSITSQPAYAFPSSRFENDGELDQLFSLMQKVLTPQERAVFIMKKSFEKEYEWIEKTFGISYENCRQLLHRAKTKLRRESRMMNYQGGSPLYTVFLKASRNGNLSELITVLKEEIAVANN